MGSRSRKLWILPVVTLALSSCSDDVTDPESTSVPPSDLDWRPCNITTEAGLLVSAAECAELVVPSRRAVASSRPVTLAIKRYRRTDHPRGQLWLLAGGPGNAASDFEVDADFYASLGGDLEVYFMDHRGTGRSTRLECPDEEAPTSPSGSSIRGSEWASCATRLLEMWGEDLSGFSTTEAALDLGEAIDRTRHGGEQVFLYAVSYGTYLAERYLQLYPAQTTGIILDSICAPSRCELLLTYDRQFDATARRIFDYCARDVACLAELGTDPWSHVTSLSTALRAGHCAAAGWSSDTLRQVLGVMVTTARLRDYMPAVVRRLERCADSDVTALARLRQFLSGFGAEPSTFSPVLSAHIALSELSVRPFPSVEAVKDNVASLYASVDEGPRIAPAIGIWPVYERDQYYGTFGETAQPLLMLNGELDPQTPPEVATPTGDHYRRPNQNFFVIPYSPHTTLNQSLLDDSDITCGAELARQFLAAPESNLDTSCLGRVLPLAFSGYAGITPLLFGTDSPFGE